MTTSIRSMSIIAIFAAAAIVPVASAGASPIDPVLPGYDSAPPVETSSGISSLTALSHDSNPTVTPHRDGSKASPFVADLDPAPTGAGDGFDWGDAGIGAGAVVLAACLAMLAAAGFSGRRTRTSRPATTASQSA